MHWMLDPSRSNREYNKAYIQYALRYASSWHLFVVRDYHNGEREL